MNIKDLIRKEVANLIQEKMILKDYGDYANKVAAAYDARPVSDPSASGMWQALAAHNERLFKQLQTRIDVQFIDDYEERGYTTAEEMTQRVADTKEMLVDKRFSDHQVWSKLENWKFRAVHDYIVHIGGKKPFGLRGELQSYNLHAKLVPANIRPAIFSEVVGQVCYQLVTGAFPDPQKVCVLYGFDYVNVGGIEEREYMRNFEELSPEETQEIFQKFGLQTEEGEDENEG